MRGLLACLCKKKHKQMLKDLCLIASPFLTLDFNIYRLSLRKASSTLDLL